MIHIFLHNVAWLRRHHSLTKKEMAYKIGVSVGTLNKIEKGILPPNLKIDVLFQIQKEFGVSMADCVSVCLEESSQ